MMKQKAVSGEATRAIRQAEAIMRKAAPAFHASRQPPVIKVRKRLVHGVLIVLFFGFCFLPTIAVLVLMGVGIWMTR